MQLINNHDLLFVSFFFFKFRAGGQLVAHCEVSIKF